MASAGRSPRHLGDPVLSLRAATSIAEVAPRSSEQLLRGAWLALTLSDAEAMAWAARLAQRSLDERQEGGEQGSAWGAPGDFRGEEIMLKIWKSMEINVEIMLKGVNKNGETSNIMTSSLFSSV